MKFWKIIGILSILVLVSCSQIQKYELGNKAILIVKPLPNTHIVAIDALVHDGLIDESRPGIRNFIQSLLVKGTAKHNATELALLLDELGSFSASTGEDYMELQFKVQMENVPQALDMLAEFLENATFPQDEMEKERTFILESIRTQEDNPVQALKNGLLQQLYPNHPYSINTLGTAESIKNITRQGLLDYYQGHYAAPYIVISIVGDVDPEGIHNQVEAKLQGLNAAAPVRTGIPLPQALSGKMK